MKKTVAHSIYPYLFITGSWIYSQLMGIKKYENVVITSKKQNLDIFPFDRVYSVSDSRKVYKAYIKVYRKVSNIFTMKNYMLNTFTSYTYSMLKDLKVDLIHSHFGNIGWEDLKSKRRLGLPQITTFYGYDISQLPRQGIWEKRFGELFEYCNLFTVEGEYMKQALINLGCNEKKVIVQHLGIDLDKIKFSKREIGNDGIIKVLIAGTFREKKGIPYAVEAFAVLCKKYKNLRLTIIGDGKSSEEMLIKNQILKLIKDYGIQDYVNMLGFQPYSRLITEAQEHHIFLSPSVQAEDGDNEGGAPVTIIEMSALGMPVISTFHCDIPSVIINGESGYLVKERNVGDIVERLEYLVNNPGLWPKIGEAGRRHIEKEYDIKKQVILLESIYDRILLK